MRFDKILICSGHMIDSPDRRPARFPATKEGTVRARIAEQLERWGVGERDLAICGGASGADILFAEECLRCGARLRLLLAQEVDDFIRDSVRSAGEEWVGRFHSLCEKAAVQTLANSNTEEPNESSIYARTNLWIIDSARSAATAPADIYALLVWDEKSTGDGPGGTSDFREKVCHLGGQIEIINPTQL